MIKLTSNGSLAILHFETQKGNSFNLEDILELQTLLNMKIQLVNATLQTK